METQPSMFSKEVQIMIPLYPSSLMVRGMVVILVSAYLFVYHACYLVSRASC